ncbi:hypothetical protein BO82DRAFT_202328 [Aspergillus uvarum CBS 121591]|uniref:Uncharacterized protein n=1 Tax=Aspergillus uvarum CBS 121591 TaxID=1448315 RepID=A0A319BVA6_9EURO|nr:hypothetical protein BO82DRAFT_202328 [Aspergillus uvarum CBS 121591]PYH76554.1 hypothetical protein BO82DRAFT_202328 [Aspergillus uvarum CBS 121591]
MDALPMVVFLGLFFCAVGPGNPVGNEGMIGDVVVQMREKGELGLWWKQSIDRRCQPCILTYCQWSQTIAVVQGL